MTKFAVRKIRQDDNPLVANIIRTVMTEFGAVGPGFSIEDPEVDAMFEAYEDPRSVFYVLLNGDQPIGCGGVSQLVGGDSGVCELKKMYFLPEGRGQGAGRVLAELLIIDARRLGYHRIYIETLQRMVAANHLYRRLGFKLLDGCLGATGHVGCDLFYALDLDPVDEIVIGE
jgi:putative acetyltransferase